MIHMISNMSEIGSCHSQLLLQLPGEILVDVLIIPIFPPLLGLDFGRRVGIVGAFFELLKIVLVFLQQSQHLSILDDFLDLFRLLLGLFGFFVLLLVLG